MKQPHTPKPKSSLMVFASMLSAVAAILAAPLIMKAAHWRVFQYLNASFDSFIAQCGAWLVVALLVGCCYSGLSTLLQILVFKMAQPRREHF